MATEAKPQIAASDANPTSARGSLLRVLGVGFGLAVIIGNTIGSGILRTPGEIATWLPNAWLFIGVWIVGGLYALLGAFSVSELSAMTPRSGGYYIYARRAFGDFPAFVVGWTDFLAQTGTTAAVAIVIGEYAGDLIPALAVHPVLVACAVAVGMALFQWHSIVWGSFVQNFTGAVKTFGFILLVGAIFVFRRGAPASAVSLSVANTHLGIVAIVLALQAVIYTYDGWYAVMYFGEEVHDPGKDIPKSMIGGVLSVVGIYLLVNAAILYVLPVSQVAGQDLALGTVAKSIFGPLGDTSLRVLTIVSMLSGINAYHLMGSRIPFAMSRDGMLPKRLGNANRGGTPTVALFLAVLASVGLIALAKVFERALAICAFYFVTDYMVAYAGVFVLRRREPDAPRPYRAWGFPWTTGIALIGSVAFLIGALVQDTSNSLWALGVLALASPLYLIARRSMRNQAA